jgi:hypothetical protein
MVTSMNDIVSYEYVICHGEAVLLLYVATYILLHIELLLQLKSLARRSLRLVFELGHRSPSRGRQEA